MQIDKLNPPECLYYEDTNLKKVGVDNINEIPTDPRIEYQISKFLVVQESICRVGSQQKAKWPVKLLEWALNKMPQRWKAIKSGQIAGGITTINGMYPVIKYLVEKRNWNLNDAGIICAGICGRCSNKLLQEVDPSFTLLPMRVDYFEGAKGTWCKYCKIIDPDYDKKHRVWCVCRTWNMGGDVERAYRETSCFSSPGYWDATR